MISGNVILCVMQRVIAGPWDVGRLSSLLIPIAFAIALVLERVSPKLVS